jgi:hypothetical protein
VQDACPRALRAVGNFSNGNARGWVLTIVSHTAYGWLHNWTSVRPGGLLAIWAFSVPVHGSHFYVCLVAWHGRQCGDFGDGKINIFAPTGTALAISVGPLAVTNGGTLTIPGLWCNGEVTNP